MRTETADRSGLLGSLVRRLRGHGSKPDQPVATPDAAEERVTVFLAALQELSAKMKADIPLPDLMAVLAAQSVIALEADIALIRLTDGDGNGLIVSGVHGVAPHRVAGLLGSYAPMTDVFRSLWPGSLATFDLQQAPPPLLTPAEYVELQELATSQLLVLPLHHRGRLVGRLDLGRQQHRPFTVDDRAAGTVLAGLVASAVCQPESVGEREEFAVMEASYEFQQSIRQLSTAAETLQGMVESIRGITNSDRCYGLLWEEPKREFTPVAVSGLEPELMDALKATLFSPGRVPALAQAMTAAGPVVIPDATASPLLPADVSRALRIHAAVVVPLRGHENRPLGALMLDTMQAGQVFSEQDLTIIGNVAEHASVILENALLYEDLKRTSESLALVNEIGIDLTSRNDLDEVFRQLYHHLNTMLDASRFCIGLLLPDGKSLEYRYAVDARIVGEIVTVPVADDPLSWVVNTQRRVIVNSRHPRDRSCWFPPAPDLTPAESMLAVPMVIGQRVVGVISAQSSARGAYSDYDLDLLATIGMQTAVAIENARLYTMVHERGELRGYLLDQVLIRQEAERKQVVDDIHNDTLQGLASCLFRIDVTSRRVAQMEPAETQQELLDVRDNLAQNIDRLRRLIFQIRPSTLDILGLAPALQEYFTQLEQETGLYATLDVDLDQRLDSEQETILYRMVQEAIGHVRQRDDVTRIVVRIRERDGKIVVTIADDGQGVDPATLAEPALVGAAVGQPIPESRMSLLTLKERAELAGGHLRLASRAAGGSTIQIVLPLRQTVRSLA